MINLKSMCQPITDMKLCANKIYCVVMQLTSIKIGVEVLLLVVVIVM